MKKLLAIIIALTLCLCVSTVAIAANDAGATDTIITSPMDDVAGGQALDDAAGESITQSVNNVVSAAIKFVFAAVTLLLTKYAIPFARNTVAPFIRNTIIPWLEEHRLRAMVDRLVHGAEQLANSGQIPKAEKKQYVVDMLKAMGVDVTPEVDAIIEGAVLDLDKTLKELLQAVIDEIKGKDGEAAVPGGAPGDTVTVPDLPQVEPAPETGGGPNAGEA